MNIEVNVSIDTHKKLSAIEDEKLGLFAADTWHRLYYDFCPRDTGNLYGNVDIKPWEIEHKAPYSQIVYERNANYRRDKAPMATSHWSSAAEPAQKPKLIQSIQNYINAGGLNLE